METNKNSSHTLEIDGMNGDACIKKVTDSLKGLDGVTTQGVELGSATITANDAGCKSACEAIGRAGYKTHESSRLGNAATTPHANTGSRQHENKGDGRTTSPAPAAAPAPVVTTGSRPSVSTR